MTCLQAKGNGMGRGSDSKASPVAQLGERLRCMSREAAAAALHHAEMSQRYLDLSARFGSVAEQAGGLPQTELSSLLQKLLNGGASAPRETLAGADQRPSMEESAGAGQGRGENGRFSGGDQDSRSPVAQSGVSAGGVSEIRGLELQLLSLIQAERDLQRSVQEASTPRSFGPAATQTAGVGADDPTTGARAGAPGESGGGSEASSSIDDPTAAAPHRSVEAGSGADEPGAGAVSSDTGGRVEVKEGKSKRGSPDPQVASEVTPQSVPRTVRGRRRGSSGSVGKTDSVRRFVARTRSAKLAPKERIRIRARKRPTMPEVISAVQELRRSYPSLSVSTMVVLFVGFLLTFWQMETVADVGLSPIEAEFAGPEEELPPDDVIVEDPAPEPEPEEVVEEEPDEPTPEEPLEEEEPDPEQAEEEKEIPEEPPVAEEGEPMVEEVSDESSSNAKETEADATPRSEAARAASVAAYGGSAASESAVANALKWLQSVQRADGSWDFRDPGPAGTPGTVLNPIGGTAYALLPFLACGQTHQQGEYQKTVGAGLNYLTQIGVRVPAGYDLRGVLNKGNEDDEPNEAYYVHATATLALCEAFWMTGDRRLRPAAEGALRFLLQSQDPRGGGWRYLPQQPGSTSVTAMALLAVKAGEKAGFRIPPLHYKGISHYLDSVRVDGAGRYGYEVEKKSYRASITAMALLSRIYLGWQREDGDLADGIVLLDRKGPYDNLYYNYFATQVMKHWGGEEWERWNNRLRDDLIGWQETEGPAAGSWTPRDRADYSRSGGRLLATCLATLTLQVYYRYDPLLPPPESAEPSGVVP